MTFAGSSTSHLPIFPLSISGGYNYKIVVIFHNLTWNAYGG